MNFRFMGILSLLAVVMLAAPAAAQSFTITVTGPDAPVEVRGGQSATANVDVNLHGEEFGCVQETELPVEVTVSANQVSPTVSPANLTYVVSPGVYSTSAPVGSAYNETQSASVSIQVPSGQTSGFSGQVTVTATFPGGDYTPAAEGGCGPGQFPSAQGTATIDVQVTADATTGDGGDGTDGSDGGDGGDGGTGGNNTDGEDENGSPMAAWLVPAALIGAALVAARRRTE